jgi:8-oxo-dGTP pyrophosphatase MutT (NUDIX family)
MEYLGELNDKIIGTNCPKLERYRIKKSARAILFNPDDKIAILYVSKDNYHKLPGGSLEGDEDLKTALKREVLEETGFIVKSIEKEVGMILEFRNDFN